MSKSHVSELCELYTHLLADMGDSCPALRGEFERDLSRLLRLSKQRGIHLFMVDLPAVGKHFDRCLDNGQFVLSGLPLTRRFSGRVVIPKLFRGLYLLVFEETGRLKEDCSHEAILFLRQLFYCAKKAVVQCSPEAVIREVDEFYAVDLTLPEPEQFWQICDSSLPDIPYRGFSSDGLFYKRLLKQDDSIPLSVRCGLLVTLDQVSRVMSSALGDFSPSDWRFRHGPGAISQATGPLNKYNWFNWSDRLESVFPIADYGYHNWTAWTDSYDSVTGIGSEDPSSRLIAVPKTLTKPRLIAAEPSEHQWCQQSIWHYFCKRTEHSWIGNFVHFRDQSLNQELCRLGSEDGDLCTVDLSAASDRVSCRAVGQLFWRNPGLLQALRATRTRSVQQTISNNCPKNIPLRKFSTMGSACTFPVESLMFLSIAIASVLTARRLTVTTKNIEALSGEVAVFGDDIVVPKDSRELLFALLEVLYFKVNASKSFWSGNFRESCGVDSFQGVTVTPVFWKGPNNNRPESVASTFDVRNHFYTKFFLRTADYLASTIRGYKPVVRMDSGVMGLKTFVGPRVPPRKTRYNVDLQRFESLLPVISSPNSKTKTNDNSALFQYFTEQPDPTTKWEHGFTQRPISKLRDRWVPVTDFLSQES